MHPERCRNVAEQQAIGSSSDGGKMQVIPQGDHQHLNGWEWFEQQADATGLRIGAPGGFGGLQRYASVALLVLPQGCLISVSVTMASREAKSLSQSSRRSSHEEIRCGSLVVSSGRRAGRI